LAPAINARRWSWGRCQRNADRGLYTSRSRRRALYCSVVSTSAAHARCAFLLLLLCVNSSAFLSLSCFLSSGAKTTLSLHPQYGARDRVGGRRAQHGQLASLHQPLLLRRHHPKAVRIPLFVPRFVIGGETPVIRSCLRARYLHFRGFHVSWRVSFLVLSSLVACLSFLVRWWVRWRLRDPGWWFATEPDSRSLCWRRAPLTYRPLAKSID